MKGAMELLTTWPGIELAGESGKAPERVLLFRRGLNTFADREPVLVDDLAARAIQEHFTSRGRDLVIDYEHQSEFASKSGQSAPAAGWITGLVWDDAGLWAMVNWTARAAAMIGAREYRYFSPVYYATKTERRVVALKSLALTNTPATNNQLPLAASEGAGDEEETIVLEKLKKLLGLAESASEDDLIQAVERLHKEQATEDKDKQAGDDQASSALAAELASELGLAEAATTEDAVLAIKALKTGETAAEKLSQDVARLSKELATMKADALIQDAVAEGKVTPAELKDWAREMATTQPETFRKVVLARERGSMVPVDQAKPAKETSSSDKWGQLDEEQARINEQLGITKENWEKYGPKAEEA